jgi:enoyl-CoA hydratase/carnithine racemase
MGSDQAGSGSGDPEGTGKLRSWVRDGVARIEIDNPGKRNAMTGQMWRALPPLLDRLDADPDVRSVVLIGHGGTFCAGADISELTTMRETPGAGGAEDPGGPREDVVTVAEAALFAFPKPTIAVVDGFCIGGGCQLAVGCDLRLATDRARFGITPAKLGIVYPASSLARLTALVGPSAAKLLLYSADLIDADHALRIGLVDEVRPAGEILHRVHEFTGTLASRSQLTLHAAKDVIDAAAAGSRLAERARHWDDVARSSGEAAEGIAAFLERRAPSFPWTPGRRG